MNCTTTLPKRQTQTEANKHPDRATAPADRAAPNGRTATSEKTPASDRAAVDAMAQSANKTAIVPEGDR
ncbi:hypothetical protein [Natrinema sp. DC36]|uniref:hypothetical protein n=1 Tax=Natrinema sp. DC36 TaxID=2878680 RepID=UPI001CF04B05|nr:hypothetical protein [Natrinema sp. DC36]